MAAEKDFSPRGTLALACVCGGVSLWVMLLVGFLVPDHAAFNAPRLVLSAVVVVLSFSVMGGLAGRFLSRTARLVLAWAMVGFLVIGGYSVAWFDHLKGFFYGALYGPPLGALLGLLVGALPESRERKAKTLASVKGVWDRELDDSPA